MDGEKERRGREGGRGERERGEGEREVGRERERQTDRQRGREQKGTNRQTDGQTGRDRNRVGGGRGAGHVRGKGEGKKAVKIKFFSPTTHRSHYYYDNEVGSPFPPPPPSSLLSLSLSYVCTHSRARTHTNTHARARASKRQGKMRSIHLVKLARKTSHMSSKNDKGRQHRLSFCLEKMELSNCLNIHAFPLNIHILRT